MGTVWWASDGGPLAAYAAGYQGELERCGFSPRSVRDRMGVAGQLDRWLAGESKQVSTRTLQDVRSILRRAISRAQARDKVKRNVVMLCELPKGKAGRPRANSCTSSRSPMGRSWRSKRKS